MHTLNIKAHLTIFKKIIVFNKKNLESKVKLSFTLYSKKKSIKKIFMGNIVTSFNEVERQLD